VLGAWTLILEAEIVQCTKEKVSIICWEGFPEEIRSEGEEGESEG